MKYNFADITLSTITGEEIKDHNIHTIIGNTLYQHAKSLDLVETARAIFRGEAVELDKIEIGEIKKLLSGDNAPLAAFAQKAVFDYIESVKATK